MAWTFRWENYEKKEGYWGSAAQQEDEIEAMGGKLDVTKRFTPAGDWRFMQLKTQQDQGGEGHRSTDLFTAGRNFISREHSRVVEGMKAPGGVGEPLAKLPRAIRQARLVSNAIPSQWVPRTRA